MFRMSFAVVSLLHNCISFLWPSNALFVDLLNSWPPQTKQFLPTFPLCPTLPHFARPCPTLPNLALYFRFLTTVCRTKFEITILISNGQNISHWSQKPTSTDRPKNLIMASFWTEDMFRWSVQVGQTHLLMVIIDQS